MRPLDDATLTTELSRLDGWELDDGALARTYTFVSFRAAIDAIAAIADLAEDADHHPELTNVYARLTVRWTTHDADGVTSRDLEMARRTDEVVHV
ncbi:4a-hydroxytetrahydrobiopterin dehydratase [Nitriliruptoraceae bacterium ZYF776]|nr:4a-hydroxytetrahydrobiopterin dehydratase [Profundirhabdus halotolerans]